MLVAGDVRAVDRDGCARGGCGGHGPERGAGGQNGGKQEQGGEAGVHVINVGAFAEVFEPYGR